MPSPLQDHSVPRNDKNYSWGSFHCVRKKLGKSCDLCNHMSETSTVKSIFYDKNFQVHGHLAHDHAPPDKVRWFIYKITDLPCQKEIVGSTQDPKARWANYKSTCNKQTSNGTGLCKHFMSGCPNDKGQKKETLEFTLIDYFDTTKEKLARVNHIPGPKCRCNECQKLKTLEDRWILRLGSFFGSSGLNSRDEVKRKTRCQWTMPPD